MLFVSLVSFYYCFDISLIMDSLTRLLEERSKAIKSYHNHLSGIDLNYSNRVSSLMKQKQIIQLTLKLCFEAKLKQLNKQISSTNMETKDNNATIQSENLIGSSTDVQSNQSSYVIYYVSIAIMTHLFSYVSMICFLVTIILAKDR